MSKKDRNPILHTRLRDGCAWLGRRNAGRQLIEFVLESRNFKLHGHDVRGADLIVCGKHNWEELSAGGDRVEEGVPEVEAEERGGLIYVLLGFFLFDPA